MFGYVITDENNKVTGIVREDFDKYKIVDDIEKYEIGSQYPIVEDLEDYQIVGCSFLNGVNTDKIYYFRSYECLDSSDIGSYALVDTVYGVQVVLIVELYEKENFKLDIVPERDLIEVLCSYDEFIDRQRLRKEIKQNLVDILKNQKGRYAYTQKPSDDSKPSTKEEPKKKDDNVFVIKFDDDKKEELEKIIEDIFNGWPSMFR